MGTKTRSQKDMSIDSLVKMVKHQQEQLQTLLIERKILEDRVKLQHERWVSDARLYEGYISQLQGNLVGKDLACLVEAAKSDMMVGLKDREVSLYKLKLEQVEDELEDFIACFDCVSRTHESNSEGTQNGMEGDRCGDAQPLDSKILINEAKQLKLEYERLASEKQSEVSALLKEKSFLWNQYEVLESNLADKLKSKQAEVDQTNEKIVAVLSRVELLQTSNNEKDETIARLNAKLTEVEADRNKWKEEIAKLIEVEADRNKRKEENSRLSQELETLRRCKSAQVTLASINVNAGTKDSGRVVRYSGRNASNIVAKKEFSQGKSVTSSKDNTKGSRSSKRKGDEVITILETPKLFTTAFKVPKLKD